MIELPSGGSFYSTGDLHQESTMLRTLIFTEVVRQRLAQCYFVAEWKHFVLRCWGGDKVNSQCDTWLAWKYVTTIHCSGMI